MIEPKEQRDCITVQQLKEFVQHLPVHDPATMEPYEVWIGTGSGSSNPCRLICRLNKGDIILETEQDEETD